MKPSDAKLISLGPVECWEWEDQGIRHLELTGKGVLEDYEVDALAGDFVDEDHYSFIVSGDCNIYRPPQSDALSMFSCHEGPEDRLLASFRKGVLPADLCRVAADNLTKAATKTDNRGLASGKIDPSRLRRKARGKVVMLGGSGTRARYLLPDGTMSKVDIANQSYSGVVGYYNSEERHPFCRQTVYTKNYPHRTLNSIPFLEAIDRCFQKQAPHRWKAQKEFVDGSGIFPNGWTLGNTVFTTLTVNKNWRTACHKDAGDYPQGFGNLTVLERGVYKGGYTGFPKFRIAVDVRQGDFLAMDVHQWHCNTPIEAVDEDYKRVSVVCYARVKMKSCGGQEEENKRRAEWLVDFIKPKDKAVLNAQKVEEEEALKEAEVAYLQELFGED